MPYFRMIETDTDYSGDFHGSDGPIIVRRFKPDEWNPPSRAFYDAALANGFRGMSRPQRSRYYRHRSDTA